MCKTTGDICDSPVPANRLPCPCARAPVKRVQHSRMPNACSRDQHPDATPLPIDNEILNSFWMMAKIVPFHAAVPAASRRRPLAPPIRGKRKVARLQRVVPRSPPPPPGLRLGAAAGARCQQCYLGLCGLAAFTPRPTWLRPLRRRPDGPAGTSLPPARGRPPPPHQDPREGCRAGGTLGLHARCSLRASGWAGDVTASCRRVGRGPVSWGVHRYTSARVAAAAVAAIFAGAASAAAPAAASVTAAPPPPLSTLPSGTLLVPATAVAATRQAPVVGGTLAARLLRFPLTPPTYPFPPPPHIPTISPPQLLCARPRCSPRPTPRPLAAYAELARLSPCSDPHAAAVCRPVSARARCGCAATTPPPPITPAPSTALHPTVSSC